MAAEAPGNTLNATALVHEAYLRLVGPPTPPAGTTAATSSPPPPRPCAASWWTPPAEATRKARRRPTRIDLTDVPAAAADADDDLLALDEALTRLAAEDPVAAGGRTPPLRRAVDRGGGRRPRHLAGHGRPHWTYARAWLRDCRHGGRAGMTNNLDVISAGVALSDGDRSRIDG